MKLFLVFCCCSFFVFGQTSKEVFETYTNKFQKRNNFRVSTIYKTYRSQGEIALSTIKGEKRYTDLGYIEKTDIADNIIGKDFSLQLNYQNKLIYYTPVVINPKGQENFKLEALLPYFELQPLDIVESTYKVVFNLRLKQSDFSYSRIEFYIDKRSYDLKKQVFYSTELTNFSKSSSTTDLDIQRIEIGYYNYKDFETIETPEIYKKQSYILEDTTSEDKKLKLHPKYKGYQLITAP